MHHNVIIIKKNYLGRTDKDRSSSVGYSSPQRVLGSRNIHQ